MLLTLISALIIGVIVGPIARLLLPGKQRISAVMTVLIGAAGALVGATVVASVSDRSGFNVVAIVVGIAAAVVLVVLYGLMTGKSGAPRG